ncbi:4Fe-4S binding protein [Desulfolutivibrio sulfoxidireducens]|uniref:4Fe-4S binding protein n=1 Tax=Desulfolutivibrio sulfoxidireducens TaxID=2773299 RepID=UPI00159E401D|nr:4Fe-4S binding protein [Desulfolutivibrio sulfoxidireducens]QLA21180.1 4Fe-4S dicluster domain-containing protein [Desulfolutivibrio sulfoxidireducens]
MSDPSFRITACRGIPATAEPAPEGPARPHALAMRGDTSALLARTLHDAGWPDFLAAREHTVRHHQALKIVLAGCPNACSGPQIADFGLIRACRPAREPDRCTGCGACVAACPEQAVTLSPKGPVIDRKICLGCGLCARACPHDALTPGRMGWRVMAGGRLGRHPALAVELPGLFTDAEAADLLASLVAFAMARLSPGTRLAALLPRDQAALGRILRGTPTAPSSGASSGPPSERPERRAPRKHRT